jgi:imidazolonepropionase-like amidohydrolase
VRDGRIEAAGPSGEVALPAGAERIDLAGKTVMPGIFNAHGHTNQNAEDILRLFARYGVTTVVSLGNDSPTLASLHASQDTPPLDRARLYFSGQVSGSPAQAAARIEELPDAGADWAKIRLDSGRGASDPGYREVVARAHELGVRVAAHIYTLEDARRVLEHGTDLVAHSVRDREVDDHLIELFHENGSCLSPTLTREVSTFIYQSTPDFFSDPFFLRYADEGTIRNLSGGGGRGGFGGGSGRDALEMAQVNLKALHDAGVGVALGTDSGASASRFPGYFEHMEMELMVEAGLTPMEVVVAATGGAARCMGLDAELGTLVPGKWADFLVLGADPLEDIDNTKTLESVWIAGSRVPDQD